MAPSVTGKAPISCRTLPSDMGYAKRHGVRSGHCRISINLYRGFLQKLGILVKLCIRKSLCVCVRVYHHDVYFGRRPGRCWRDSRAQTGCTVTLGHRRSFYCSQTTSIYIVMTNVQTVSIGIMKDKRDEKKLRLSNLPCRSSEYLHCCGPAR